MGLHFPFKDLMFKLWTKKRLEVKLLWVKKIFNWNVWSITKKFFPRNVILQLEISSIKTCMQDLWSHKIARIIIWPQKKKRLSSSKVLGFCHCDATLVASHRIYYREMNGELFVKSVSLATQECMTFLKI
jgi:hypothetical protein